MFTRTCLFRDISCMCCSTLLLWLRCICLQSSHLQWLSLPVLGRGWANLGPPWAWVGLHQTAGCSPCVVRCEAFIDRQGLQSDQVSTPSLLLGLQWGWCVWLSSTILRAWVTLELCWLLSGLLANCHTCSISLDRHLQGTGWRWQVGRRMWGRACHVNKACMCLLWEGTCSLRQSTGECRVGHTVSKLGGDCSPTWFL